MFWPESDQSDAVVHPTDVIEDAHGSLLVADTGSWYLMCCPTSPGRPSPMSWWPFTGYENMDAKVPERFLVVLT